MLYKKIDNIKELKEEKGIYYAYLMQIMGCPVIDGVLIPETDMKYFYNQLIPGIFETLAGTQMEGGLNSKMIAARKISKEQFIWSMYNTLADCFYDGCDLEDFDEDIAFAFLNSEKYVECVM